MNAPNAWTDMRVVDNTNPMELSMLEKMICMTKELKLFVKQEKWGCPPLFLFLI